MITSFARAVLTFNIGLLIRLLRFGYKDASQRSINSFYLIDPFERTGQSPPPLTGLTSYRSIPEVSLSEVVGGRLDRMISINGDSLGRDGALPIGDLIPLLSILVDRNPSGVLEVGTFDGTTTRLIARNLPNAAVHTVDLPEDFDAGTDTSPIPKDDFHLIAKRRVGVAYRNDPEVSNVTQHFHDTVAWDFAGAAGCDFFFIDGSHTYEYVKNDTKKCLAVRKDRPTTIVWHDCDPYHDGVVRWLSEMVQEGFFVKRVAGTNLAVLDYARD